jgi:sugar phosphate isomerase/epimerase
MMASWRAGARRPAVTRRVLDKGVDFAGAFRDPATARPDKRQPYDGGAPRAAVFVAETNVEVGPPRRVTWPRMAFSRCFSTLGCPDLSLDETLALATRHGVDAVELRALGGTVELPKYFAAEFGSPGKLAARVRGQSVRIASLDTSLHLAGGAAGERDAFLEFLPWAEALGVPWLRVFDGKAPLAEPRAIAEAAESVGWWRELRRARGFQADIMVETHDVLFTAAAIRRFLVAAPGTAILWDAHHTWKKGGEEPVATWRDIWAAVPHVHVKDSVAVPSARHPFTYVLPGDGAFPIAPLLAALNADAFAGAVSLEWEKLWHPHLPPLDVALSTAAQRRWW